MLVADQISILIIASVITRRKHLGDLLMDLLLGVSHQLASWVINDSLSLPPKNKNNKPQTNRTQI